MSTTATETVQQTINRQVEWRPFFTWEYSYSVDSQGRIQFPLDWRPPSGQLDMVAVWLRHKRSGKEHLQLITLDAFSKLSQPNPETGSEEDKEKRQAVQHALARRSFQVGLDKSGRLNLPKKLLERAGIGSEAILLGCGDRIEVWSQDDFEEALEQESELIPEDLRVPRESKGEKGK